MDQCCPSTSHREEKRESHESVCSPSFRRRSGSLPFFAWWRYRRLCSSTVANGGERREGNRRYKCHLLLCRSFPPSPQHQRLSLSPPLSLPLPLRRPSIPRLPPLLLLPLLPLLQQYPMRLRPCMPIPLPFLDHDRSQRVAGADGAGALEMIGGAVRKRRRRSAGEGGRRSEGGRTRRAPARRDGERRSERGWRGQGEEGRRGILREGAR